MRVTSVRACWFLCVAVTVIGGLASCRHEQERLDGRTPAEWAAALHNDDPTVRRRAAQAFASILPLSRAGAHTLLDALATEDNADVHATIANSLTLLGPDARDVAPMLVRLLRDQHESVRAEAAASLGSIFATARLDSVTATVVRALAASLGDPVPEVRMWAAQALTTIGPAAVAAAPALAAAVSDPAHMVRLDAVRALGTVGASAEVSVPALVTALTGEHDEVRLAAAFGLARFGAAGASAVPELRRAVSDETFGVRGAAVAALGAIGPEARAAVPELMRATTDADSTVRAWAVDALARVAPEPTPAKPGSPRKP